MSVYGPETFKDDIDIADTGNKRIVKYYLDE